MSAKLKEFGFISAYDNIFKFLSDKNNENDTKNYIISISGYGDLICFGSEKKLLIASLNYSIRSKNSDNVNFIVNFQDSICDNYTDVNISSILIIPIASLKQSSQGYPDWSCICVGFTNGMIKFYDQNGQLIFTQKIHNYRIEQIKLHSSPCYNAPEVLSESLMVLCNNCCYQIDGVHLYESLNLFKKQLARLQAGFIDYELESFQLSYKKWLLESQESVMDIVFGYETSECVLNNIFLNASNKGPFATVPEQLSKNMNCVTVGKNPFITFYKMPLENDALDMGDLAQAVYSKVKGVISTSFSSWLGSSKSITKNLPVKKSETINSDIPSRFHLRHTVEESSRRATMIISCPQYNVYSRLAAMTDDFGRIFLIDIDDGTIVRIWKGYRDAQISITTSSIDNRHVNFLVIYSPRRSMIEIWTVPYGERVASFDMRDRYGRLLHVPHGLLGISRCFKSSNKMGHYYSTFFLDSTGKVSILEIPFHLSLVNSSNERFQDHLIIKHFKSFLKEQKVEPDLDAIKKEISLAVHALKLTSSIDILSSSIMSLSYLSMEFILSIFTELIELTTSDTLASSSTEIERFHLKQNCLDIVSLINCYKSLITFSKIEILSNNELNLEYLLNLDIEDCERIKKLFNLYCHFHKNLCNNSLDNKNYYLFTNNFTNVSKNSESYACNFQLSKNVVDKDILNIGYMMFNQCITGENSIDTVINIVIHKTKIDPISCFKICVVYILHESMDIVMSNVARIKQLLSSVLSYVTGSKSIRTCFTIANDICEKSVDLLNALLLSMIMRVILCEFLHNISDNESHEFVTYLTESLLSWNVTCQRLEDLSIFNCLLKCQPSKSNPKTPKKSKVHFDRALTLAYVIENGKGIFSESFAKWAFKWNLKFVELHLLYKSLGQGFHDNNDDNQLIEECDLSSEIKDIFSILYKQLPHSLEYDSILINVSWEYTRLWSKSIQRVEYLQCACELLENVGPAGGLVIQGIGGMMWDMHIKTNLESFFNVDKSDVSKYSSNVLASIVENTIRFLNIVLKSLEHIDVMPTFSSESVWCGDKSRSSLIELAVAKDPVTENSVELHIQLLYALQLVATVDLRNFNCQILYSSDTRKYFFEPLTKNIPHDLIQCDLTQCKNHRMRFIERIVSSCTTIFTEGTDDISLCQNIHRIIKILRDKWELDVEDVRQSWIINYYKCGLDSQAAMYLDKVENTTLLAASLLKIVGLRIKKEYLLPKCKNYREYFKYVTPQLSKWFQNLDNATIKETTLQQSAILIDQILEWLPENSFDFETSTCLQSLIMNIEKTKKYVE